ncbi:hypothetical protein BDFB_013256, partial [Asbolus verrucosus]
ATGEVGNDDGVERRRRQASNLTLYATPNFLFLQVERGREDEATACRRTPTDYGREKLEDLSEQSA